MRDVISTGLFGWTHGFLWLVIINIRLRCRRHSDAVLSAQVDFRTCEKHGNYTVRNSKFRMLPGAVACLGGGAIYSIVHTTGSCAQETSFVPDFTKGLCDLHMWPRSWTIRAMFRVIFNSATAVRAPWARKRPPPCSIFSPYISASTCRDCM